MKELLTFNFGNSFQDDKPIIDKLIKRSGPSMYITLPVFLLGLFTSISLALIIAFFRATYIDRYGTFLCVLSMSIPTLIYIIFLQKLISVSLYLLPVSGWGSGIDKFRFTLLPIIISIIAGLGGSVRFYRTIMLEETTRDYVRTARAKGLGESLVLFKHILKNAMIPILTNTVMIIPTLFVGSLLLENFFGIPGLGSFTIDAIQANDFPSLKAVVYIGALLTQIFLILTDISYTLVDPRVVFD
jgi:peptide/nickel transport system permease protein